jgi:RNA polymerase sigma factor (TIGR02999 family)
LQPTALVHEAYLRLVCPADSQPPDDAHWNHRGHFYAAAAEAMRRVLIERARRKRAARHGGGLEKASCDVTGFDLAAPLPDEELLLLSEALDLLEAHDSRKAAIVKQWYFVGLTLPQLAELFGVNERTVRRDLDYGRAWLGGQVRRLRG